MEQWTCFRDNRGCERQSDEPSTAVEAMSKLEELPMGTDALSLTLAERIDEIDRMLFDAGVLVLSAKTIRARHDADRKITDARIALDKLRSRAGHDAPPG